MFRLDKDRLRILWTYGDQDLAYAFAEMEGYEILSGTTSYQCSVGWEQRIRKKHARRRIIPQSGYCIASRLFDN